MTTQEGATMTDETVGDKQLWFIAEAIVVGKFGTYPVYRELQRVRDDALATQAAELDKLRAELMHGNSRKASKMSDTMNDETVGDGRTVEDEIEAGLSPCPRCGGKATIEGSDEIMCNSCGFWTGDEHDDLDEAIEWWNQQPLVDSLRSRVAQLEQIIATYERGDGVDNALSSDQPRPSLDTIAKQAARIEELEETLQFAASYKGIEGRGCPLCHYEDGVYIASCQMHKDMEAQAAHVEGLERMTEFWKRAALLAVDEFVERGDELDRLRAELAEAKLTTDEYAAVDKLMFNIGKYGYMISWLMPEPDDEEHYMNLVDAWWERQKEEGE